MLVEYEYFQTNDLVNAHSLVMCEVLFEDASVRRGMHSFSSRDLTVSLYEPDVLSILRNHNLMLTSAAVY